MGEFLVIGLELRKDNSIVPRTLDSDGQNLVISVARRETDRRSHFDVRWGKVGRPVFIFTAEDSDRQINSVRAVILRAALDSAGGKSG